MSTRKQSLRAVGTEDAAGIPAVLPISRPPKASEPVARVTYSLDDWAKALGVSRRVIERERSAGRLPKPDLFLGRIPLWKIETVRGFLERGGKP